MIAALAVLLAVVGLSVLLVPVVGRLVAARVGPAGAPAAPAQRSARPRWLPLAGGASAAAGLAGCWLARHDDGFGNIGQFVALIGWLCAGVVVVVGLPLLIANWRGRRQPAARARQAASSPPRSTNTTAGDLLAVAGIAVVISALILGGRWMQRQAFDPPELAPFKPAIAGFLDHGGYTAAQPEAFASGKVLPIDLADGSGQKLALSPSFLGFSYEVTKNTGGVDRHVYFALPAGRRASTPGDVDTVALLEWSRELAASYGPIGSGPGGRRWRQYRITCRVTLLEPRARRILGVRTVQGEAPTPLPAGSKMHDADTDEYAGIPVNQVVEAIIGPSAETVRRREMMERLRNRRRSQ